VEADENEFSVTLEGAGSCPKCHYVLPRLVDCAPTYFETGHVDCRECQEKVDLWQVALGRATRLSDMSTWALTSLGAGQTSFNMEMETGQIYMVDLTSHRVPADARILSRRYASQGGEQGHVTALEWHPNDPTHRIRGTILPLFAVPLMEGPVPRKGTVGISVAWIRTEDSDAWPYLVTAFEAAAARDYAPSLVFAQSAVEIALMPLIERRFLLHAPQKAVRRFTNYYRALHVVLPYLCGEVGAAQMPESIREALESLRNRRNHIVHEGAKAAATAPKDAIEGLCAAAFGFEYLRYAAPKIEGKGDVV